MEKSTLFSIRDLAFEVFLLIRSGVAFGLYAQTQQNPKEKLKLIAHNMEIRHIGVKTFYS